MPAERLQKLLAAAGVASRRKCEELIKAGRISVNGKAVSELGTKADPDRDVVAVDGRAIAHARRVTFLLNKSVGYLVTLSDPRGRPTVMDLVPAVPGLHYIGRLDKDTEGLLLLTNDGELTNLLTHPRHLVAKTYRAWVKGHPSQQMLARLREGIELEDGKTAPAQVEGIKVKGDQALIEITIHEGRKRQVRRMFDAIGHPVIHLERTAFGGLKLGRLVRGNYRRLTLAEVDGLKRAAR